MQWCRWISELVTIYFISTSLALVCSFVFIFGEHKLYFYISKSMWLRKYDVLICHETTQLKCHVNFWAGLAHPESVPYEFLGATSLMNKEIKRFWFVIWLRDRCVTWHCGWSPLILSHELAKFGVHGSCESGHMTFSICHMITWSVCHVTLLVRSPHPKSPPY